MLLSIPQELIEHILVIAAKDGYPSAVASLSQTCKHFYQFLSLRSDNKHLWRDLFLAVFDDPLQGELGGKFGWRQEFLNRMLAQWSFKRWTTSSAAAKNRASDGKGKDRKSVKESKDGHEEEKRLLQSLRTLLKALIVENPPMLPDLSSSSSSSSTSSTSSSDSDDPDNAMPFGARLSDTHLACPLLIVLHALASQRQARGIPSSFLHAEEKWGTQLLDSIKSGTSSWAEGILKNGYPSVLKERLLTFDAWIYRRPRSRRRAPPGDFVPTVPSSLLSPSTVTDIVSDPHWELTETGRLFYKLVMMKGYLFDRLDGSAIRSNGISRKTLSEQKMAARVLARRRVYDMRYLTRERLFGPYLPVGKTLDYGLTVPKPEKVEEMMVSNISKAQFSTTTSETTNDDNTTDDSSYYPSSSQSTANSANPSDDEGDLDVFHSDMIHLISAGIHPHYLIHHHLFHHPLSDDEDLEDDAAQGGSGELGHPIPGIPSSSNRNDAGSNHINGTGRGENTTPVDPFVLADTAPHRVIPDYAFLSAARLLIEMNIKGSWCDVPVIGQLSDTDDGDFDPDFDDYNQEDVDDEDEENETNDTSNGTELEPENGRNTNEASIFTHSSSNLAPPSGLHVASTSSSTSPNFSSSSSSSTSSSSESSDLPATNNTSINQDDGRCNDNATGTGTMASPLANTRPDTRRWIDRLMDAFYALDFVRLGGAVGYWRNVGLDVKDWRRGSKTGERLNLNAEDMERGKLTRKGKEKVGANGEGEEYEGWDWAGVEGEWRRVVCWMDYQDLLLHSSGATRINPSIETDEAIRLFPLKLRITGYSPPPSFHSFSSSSPPPSSTSSVDTDLIDRYGDETTNPDALIWHLPAIHYAGESRLLESAHLHGHEQFMRQIRGTVRMIGDGAVRWTMISTHVNQTEPEWTMEGVQVGCIGSAVGVLGMWTGADHARGDPIGPCWQWKVS